MTESYSEKIEIIKRLRKYGELPLTIWEDQFIYGMENTERELTDRQKEVIDKIYRRSF